MTTWQQHLLLERFSPLERSVNRGHHGLRLGLAIAKRLAQAVGGTIGVMRGLGAGSASPANVPDQG